jgi:Mn-dependent DtxR family transcriptional regulator
VAEIASLVNISAEKVESFVRFLAKHGIVTYDEERKTAIIRADFLSLQEKGE